MFENLESRAAVFENLESRAAVFENPELRAAVFENPEFSAFEFAFGTGSQTWLGKIHRGETEPCLS